MRRNIRGSFYSIFGGFLSYIKKLFAFLLLVYVFH